MSTFPRQPGDDEPLSPRAVRLAALLEQAPRRTVTLPELMLLWAQADPASAGSPNRRGDLARMVDQLSGAGLVRPSVKKDTSARPPLPSRLTLPSTEPSAPAAAVARTVAWRPELIWVLSTRLTLGQVEHLQRINSWLRDRAADTDVLPLRERSLEILGDEKAFDRLLTTGVFAAERLTLTHLRTFRAHPPLAVVQVGDGPVLLVIENDDTFHSVRAVLQNLTTAKAAASPVGFVAWGCGGAFEASVRSCGDLPGVERVAYFGDLDADGLRIPTSAADTATSEGLPPVRPAVRLYELLLKTRVHIPGQTPVEEGSAERLASWLTSCEAADSADVAREAAALLVSGVRVPQEAVTFEHLRQASNADVPWFATL